MFPEEYNILFKIISCILLGIVIKILDNYIDNDTNYRFFDLEINNENKAILPYCLILLTIASGFCVEYTVTLLSSSYIIGMFYDLNLVLPTRLKSYHEITIIILINTILFPVLSFITSFIIILFIQLIDDIMDSKWDKKFGFKNYANKFGKVEVALFSLILLLFVAFLNIEKLLVVFFSYIIVDFLIHKGRNYINI